MSLNKPLFSIVIANFNHGKYLNKAILSVINQTCQDFELIIVDGGSTDNSVEIIKNFAQHIRWWVSEKDKGQSDAFNKGFGKAKGEFYLWLNADDLLLPRSLEYAKNAIKSYPNYKWFAADTIFISKENSVIKCRKGPVWNDFVIKNAPVYVFGPSSIFNCKIFEEVGGFDASLTYTMDTDLWMRFKNKGYKFKRIRKYFWCFRIHDDSKTSHSFSSAPNANFKKEQLYTTIKNNHKFTTIGIFKQRIFKLLFGTFIRSEFDTFRWKGKDISTITI